MKLKIKFLLVAVLGLLITITASSSQAAPTMSVSLETPAQIELTTHTVIAKFLIRADSDPFTVEQLAFDITGAGSWVYHQVTNVRLLDEHGHDLSVAKRVFSTPIVCDCDSGRVIFDEVKHLFVAANSVREITLIADLSGGFDMTNGITVSYMPGDSRIVEQPSQVNGTLQVIRSVDNEKFGILVQTPIVLPPVSIPHGKHNNGKAFPKPHQN